MLARSRAALKARLRARPQLLGPLKAAYTVRPHPEIPAHCAGWGSFRREVLEHAAAIVPAIADNIAEGVVDAVSFAGLVAAHRIDRIDVVVIDVEGYDYEVLRQIDFARFAPALVIYEALHLEPAAKAAAVALLERYGYRVERIGLNNAAVRIAR